MAHDPELTSLTIINAADAALEEYRFRFSNKPELYIPSLHYIARVKIDRGIVSVQLDGKFVGQKNPNTLLLLTIVRSTIMAAAKGFLAGQAKPPRSKRVSGAKRPRKGVAGW